VFADMLGLFTAFQPHFVRRFASMAETSVAAFEEYSKSVKEGSFPSMDESYPLDEEIYNALITEIL
jgi:3-methyl-2-oxobutanoate hydroxymethyltransferase